jgi:N-acetylglucosamine malate deacetylase 1
VAEVIRAARPRAIALPYWQDRHPDHLAAFSVLRDGVFNAKLRKYEAEGEAWQAEWICFYFINDSAPPSFVVDVSDHYDVKRKALACYRSQFTRATGAAETRLNSPGFNQLIESRDAQFGALAGVRYAEGIVTTEPVLRDGLLRT